MTVGRWRSWFNQLKESLLTIATAVFSLRSVTAWTAAHLRACPVPCSRARRAGEGVDG
jgi:hypothetical protein